MREGRKKPPCCDMVHPDTGERRGALPCWVEVYDVGGRMLGLIVSPHPESVTEWARSRPIGSEYRCLVRGGARALVRLTVRVHPGRLVEIRGSNAGGGKR